MTVINPRLPSGYTIFCDDIRQEYNGKLTFVGAYADTLIINGPLPALLPKFCAMIVYREEPTSLEPVEIKIFLPGHDYDSPATVFRIDAPQPDLVPEQTGEFLMRECRFFWEGTGVVIEQEGQVRVRAFRGDEEIKLGAMIVTISPAFRGANDETPDSVSEPSPSRSAGQ
ncbi:MAG TPA: hypothetical protein VHE36_13455 [Sphingomicrobium sp.]|nr:hypothetical protein [Sphingomicrobium sp.]